MSTDWMLRAACKNEDPELFFPVGISGPALRQVDEAKTVCRRCPVQAECLEWAIEFGQDFGVWGGMSEDERRSLKRRRERRRTPKRGSPDFEVDPHVVDLLVDGIPVPGATEVDRATAAVRMCASGVPSGKVATVVGRHDAQVRRWVRMAANGETLAAKSRLGSVDCG